MNTRTIRLKKEARALFWPWFAVTIAGVLPLVPHPYGIREASSALAFFVGIPLLATLSLGNEFQHRTISLWLSQPAGRMQIWGEKLIVSFAAVLSAAMVFWIGVKANRLADSQDFTYEVAAIAYVIVTMTSATFWTLVARSTLGGLTLNVCFIGLTNIAVFGPGYDGLKSPFAASTICAVGAVYAVALMFLGARRLARFQVTGAAAGDDLLMSGPTLLPEALARWFRCRPTGLSLNLIRKELRLLRPLWLIEAVAVLYVACLAIFRFLPYPAQPYDHAREAALVFMTLLFLLMAILAGSLSLGEERTSGTQSWHMTLPVSARRQWLIKLAVAVLAGVGCTVLPLVVLIAVGSIYGSPFMYVGLSALLAWLLAVMVLSLAAFWCACAANGTVPAALWVFPVTTAVFFAGSGGAWLGQELARKTGTVLDLVISGFHLSPLPWFAGLRDLPFLLFVLAAILFGVIQSYRLFRTQPRNGIVWMTRCLLPLALVAFLCSFSVSAGFASSRWYPFNETQQALDKLQLGTAKTEITGEDLAKGFPMTALTRRWLAGSSITVAPYRPRPSVYLATIYLASGRKCRLVFHHNEGLVWPVWPGGPSGAKKGP